MTTAYTPILKLALPQTGELSGTWGTVVNDNITLMVEQAVAGLSTISTWTANAHTLTTADGTTSEARCAMLVATNGAGGTALTGAGEIICPAATKLYVLRNSSSYAVTLKVTASTGVSVPAGQTAFLLCDSTEVYACVTTIVDATISGNLTVNGNTTLGDAATDTITATGQFNTDLLPSTDNARDLGSTAKSWRTLYCDTSVLVGNLSLASNTLSSTDTNGNIVLAPNGNGDVQLDADTVRVGDSGAAVTLTSNGAGALTVTTGGAANLVLSTNSGTTSGAITVTQGAGADIVLTPNGTGSVALPKLKVTGSSSGSVIIQAAAAAGSATYTLPSADGTNGQVLSTNGSGVLSWATAAASGVTTFSAGTTGFTPSTATSGAVTLAGTLAVANGGTGQTSLSSVTVGAATNVAGGAANRIPVNTGAGTTSFIVAPTVSSFLQWTGSAFAWGTSTAVPAGSNTQVQYNNSGSFGASSSFTWNNSTETVTATNFYGTTVEGSTSVKAGSATIRTPAGVNLSVGLNCIPSGATGSFNTALAASGALGALTNGSSNTAVGDGALGALTSASNNVAVGASALGAASYSGADNVGIGVGAGGTTTSGSNVICIGKDALASTATVSNEITLGNSSIATLRCQVTTITALSDARDKKDVQDIPLGVSFIQRLHPVSFVWNTRDGGKVDVPEFGFIAQELQQAQAAHGVTLPGLVHDINPERLEAAPGTLIPVLVKAVQELQAQIDDLKRQLAARG